MRVGNAVAGADVSSRDIAVMVGVGTLAIIGLYLFFKHEAKAAAGAVKDAAVSVGHYVAPAVAKVNPFDQQNVLATGANALYRSASGKKATDSTTLATWITDHTDVNNYDPNH